MPTGKNPAQEFSDEYIENAFFAWYRAGSPKLSSSANQVSLNVVSLAKSLPPFTDGRKPSAFTIRNWAIRDGWVQRAEALDAQVSLKLEKEAIQERIRTLKQLAKDGNLLKTKGLKYIESHADPFADNPSAAVRAIVAGAEMEWRYAGQASVLEGISDMSNKKLESEILRLLGKSNEDENTVEATLEDVADEPSEEEDDDTEPEDDNARGQ